MELQNVNPQDISDAAIRDRYLNGSRSNFTFHFLASEMGTEVGFLAVDINPDDVHFVIYGLFVPPTLRRRGIGTRIIEAAEALGRQHGYKKAMLIPKSLDEGFEQSDIEEWYRSLGYRPLLGGTCNQYVKDTH